MILAEDLLLLLYDDDSGRPVVDGTKVDFGLAGAVLLDLALQGRVAVAAKGERVRQGRLYVTDHESLGDPILDEALAGIGADDGRRTPKSILGMLKKGLRARLLYRLADRGILHREQRRVLGLFPTERWPAVDASHEREVRQRLHAVLSGAEPDERTAAIVALLHALDAVPKVVPIDDRRAAKRRAKEVAEGAWAAEAVRKAIQDIQTATMAAVMAATSAAAASGGS